jgi:Fe-S oxidoreductase
MKTFLDWSSYENAGVGDAYADIPKQGGDFAKAVAVCINSRHCESANKGVMCPSYRISNNTLLSTGGRVRLLKQALNEDDVAMALDKSELHEAMDLCLSCKGCKRECENEVDMAMIKIEYLAQRYQQNPIPLRTRLFANLPELLSRIKPLPDMIRLMNRAPKIANRLKRIVKIAQRPLPQPESQSFFSSRKIKTPIFDANSNGRDVVLFIDTFTNNFVPENAMAAIEVLKAAGYRVHLATDQKNLPACCGRTQLANGMVDKARIKAKRLLDILIPYVEDGMPVIGLEPSCLLAIRDDYKFLGLGEQAEKVAKQAVLFEEFIAREYTAKRLDLSLKPVPGLSSPVLVHGHCHQKAVGAMKSMRKVLKLIPEIKVEFIESSCCGMAGSFGLEEEHHQASLEMAELALYPAIREKPESEIIANGFSCQHQIAEVSEKKPLHIVQLLHSSLNGQALE